jgi:hypothetical protein
MNKIKTAQKARFISKLGKAGRVLVVRLKTGSDLLPVLGQIIKEKGFKAGVILSAVGLLSSGRLRNCMSLPENFPITDRNRSFQQLKVPLEILSMSGNISMAEGKPLVHSHVTLSYVEDGSIHVVGGHLIEGCIVHGFAEIIVMELIDIDMIKYYDEETKTLQIFSYPKRSGKSRIE